MDEQPSFWTDPRIRALRGFVYFVVFYLLLEALLYFFPKYYFADEFNYDLYLLLDAAVCLLGIGVWLSFFAQFALPVKTIGDRLRVVDRLVTYLMGQHGPALFVENGIVRAKAEETKKKGRGVIWLDSASAAVLRTGVAFTRTVGPGVHFTEAGEFIAATADLHPLSQAVGAEDGDKDDKDPFKIDKNHADFEAVSKRKNETLAVTRDGIEVVAAISVSFRIAAKDGEGNTRFGFNKENAEKAIRDSITRGANLEQPVWSELPAKMAVDVWREYLRKFRLSELFDTSEDRLDTAIQTINAMVGKRLKQKEVEQLDDFGRVVLKSDLECRDIFNKHNSEGRYADVLTSPEKYFGDWKGLYAFLLKNGKAKDAEDFLQKVESREYKTLLGMGLEVTGVNLKRIIFTQEIEERIMGQWTTLWKKNAEKERDLIDQDRKLAEMAGLEAAVKEYAAEATRELFKDVLPQSRYEALYYIVRNLFLSVRRNATLLKRTTTEQRELSAIYSWLRDRDKGAQ